MILYFDEENMPDEKTAKTMSDALGLALKEEGLCADSDYSVSVSFVDGEEIHSLNREYRGVDRVTDVLSFPMYNAGEIPKDCLGETELGDVVICTQRAREQAEEFGHSYERELIYLFVHSIFHLLGYDHEAEDERAVMRGKEESVMESLGILR